MNKKGFTLIELLAVLVLVVIVGALGTVGVMAINSRIKERLWNSKIDLIENGARDYGEDNLIRVRRSTCTMPDNTIKNECLTIQVKDLIDNNYIKTKETDAENNKVITNDTLEVEDPGYYVNDLNIYIYVENDLVYAELDYTKPV